MTDHPYLAELQAFARAPTATSAEDYQRHKRLLAEALGYPGMEYREFTVGYDVRFVATERPLTMRVDGSALRGIFGTPGL